MKGVVLLLLAAVRVAGAQAPDVAARADSLRLAGRPWHAAEVLLEAAARETRPSAEFVVEGAKAELRARRYDRARALLAGQPWLDDYENGEALAALAEAEAGLGLAPEAAFHYEAARARTTGTRAALLAARAGLAFQAAGQIDSAAAAYAAARMDGLGVIDAWLRLREAATTRDTARATRLLADLPAPVARGAAATRAHVLLNAGDTARALDAFAAAGQGLDAARLALATGDTTHARAAIYTLLAASPESDPAAEASGLALRVVLPGTPAERVALARTLKAHGAAPDARQLVARAIAGGDSSAATLLLYGELLAAAGRYREAERADLAASHDSTVGPLAVYRRARVLVRLGDPGAVQALSGFAAAYPSDTAAPTALYVLADYLTDRGDSAAAARWFAELFRRYPTDQRSSVGRIRLALQAQRAGQLDSAAALYGAEVAAGGPLRQAARFWMGMLARERGDTAGARSTWLALAREDSIGYYGLRARREVDLPPLAFRAAAPPPVVPAVAAALGRIDTLILAGLDSAADDEVRAVLAHPPQDVDVLLAWSAGLAARGFGPSAVRLGWQAALRSPNDPRVLRAIFPWPNRGALEAEAREFGVDPFLLAALVRQESVFDIAALSRAGARGLAQLLPGTAALTARDLDVTFDPGWITLPDYNLHLGAAHLAELLRRFSGRVEVAAAAYNAGTAPVERWLTRPGADDPDQFLELVTYPETRGYIRSVLRNRELYRALYGVE